MKAEALYLADSSYESFEAIKEAGGFGSISSRNHSPFSAELLLYWSCPQQSVGAPPIGEKLVAKASF
jgi:hypothetical protein